MISEKEKDDFTGVNHLYSIFWNVITLKRGGYVLFSSYVNWDYKFIVNKKVLTSKLLLELCD